MSDNLYRSYSLEKSSSNGEIITSGSLTAWQDSPVSPLDVGDAFRPIPNGPLLTVKKVNISDNVLGHKDGKPFRQWQISIEGNDEASSSGGSPSSQTHIFYNFNFNADEHSGTMEVNNQGDAPAFTLNIGDSFRVPGIGLIPCVSVRGSDTYDDNGKHIWTVVYEGSDALEEKPGDDNGQQDTQTKYSLSMQGSSDDEAQKTASKTVIDFGDENGNLNLDTELGATFSIPGVQGNFKCTKISGGDDYSDDGKRRWTMTYEGYFNNSDYSPPSDNNTKNSFSITEDNKSGAIEVSAFQDTSNNNPPIIHNVGDTINIPGIGDCKCTKVSGSDSYSDDGRQIWSIVYEAEAANSNDEPSNNEPAEQNVKFSFDIENNSDGITIYSGSKEFSLSGNNVSAGISIGEIFNLPIVGSLTCTKIRGSKDDSSGIYTFILEGSRSGGSNNHNEPQQDGSSLPDNEETISYELNGSTVRSVDGEFIALRRSESPILKKSITIYSESQDIIATPGSSYGGGIVLSENISKETIKNNGIITASYYKHTIEVEA